MNSLSVAVERLSHVVGGGGKEGERMFTSTDAGQ